MIHEIKLQTKRRDEMLDITAQVEGPNMFVFTYV